MEEESDSSLTIFHLTQRRPQLALSGTLCSSGAVLEVDTFEDVDEVPNIAFYFLDNFHFVPRQTTMVSFDLPPPG